MTTAYNLRNALERGAEAKRQEILDPGSGGTVKFKPFDLSVLICPTAGTRTFESATLMPNGNSVLVLSTIAAVVISASGTSYTFNAGEYGEFIVTLNSAGTKVWSLRKSSGNPVSTQSYQIPITAWRQDAALQSVLATATTSSTQLQILNGTYGTTAANLQAKPASTADTLSIAGRVQVNLPANYQAGTDVTITTTATRTVAATTSGTLLFAAYRDAAPTVNLVADSATDINAAASVAVSQTITGTNLSPGNEIDIRALIATSGGSTTAGEWHFSPVTLTYTKA